MSKTIKITGGEITLKPYVDRKTAREYNAVLSQGMDSDTDFKKLKIPLNLFEQAGDILVAGLTETLKIGENVWHADQVDVEIIGKIKSSDFQKVFNKCLSILNEEQKKRAESQEKQGSILKGDKE